MRPQQHVDERRDEPSDGPDGILSDPHVRTVIDCLRRSARPINIADLATQVVANLTNQPTRDVPANVRRRVQTWLHHGQLPILVEHNMVHYDPDRGIVQLA